MFAAGDISRAREKNNVMTALQVELQATFLGLVGSTSPLPSHFSEDLLEIDESEGKERPLGALRRASSSASTRSSTARGASTVFPPARAWTARTRPHAARSPSSASMPRPCRRTASRRRTSSDSRRCSRSEPIGARAPRAARRTLPGVPMEIESFVNRVVILDESERNKLGVKNGTSGVDFTIGARVRDRSGRFRARLGPVDYATLEELVPGGPQHDRLRDVLDRFTRGILEAEVEVLLSKGDTPRFRLGSERGERSA